MTSNEQPPPLPEVHISLLDDATLHALLRDIELGAQLLEIRAKTQATGFVNDKQWNLRDAWEALCAGELLGLQVRYVHQNQTWCDTLMTTPEGVRLVRIST